MNQQALNKLMEQGPIGVLCVILVSAVGLLFWLLQRNQAETMKTMREDSKAERDACMKQQRHQRILMRKQTDHLEDLAQAFKDLAGKEGGR